MSRIGKKSRCLWILLLLLGILAFGGCSQKEENRGEPPEEVLHPQGNNAGDGTGGSPGSASQSSEQGSTGKESDILTGVEVYFLITKRAEESAKENQIKISVGDSVFTATLEKNSSADALKELLQEGPLTIEMSDYGHMEKVGSIGTSLPTNDENITTEAGDIILYQGNSLTIYYDVNTWNLTRIGKIEDVTKEQLLEAMGSGDVTVTLTLVS